MFSYQPSLIKFVNDSNFRNRIHEQLGDIREPWSDLASDCGVSEFEAKALFATGLMRRYVLSANEILRGLKHRGFLFAYAMLGSSIELIGRCIHPIDEFRQHPERHSKQRLIEGFQYISNPAIPLPQSIIISTNHNKYYQNDLVNLRNLSVHGSCISSPSNIKADIELLHELRRHVFGTPTGEHDALGNPGPIAGGIDRYFEELNTGDIIKCDRLASAALSPLHFLKLHEGNWPFAQQLVIDIKSEAERNLNAGHPPISGGHHKSADHFELTA